ncbi:MAG: dTMP kinase [Ghiorsea sp.]
MSQGKFITFEGGDGCGKSTQLSLTIDWLQSQGKNVVSTFEPGDTGLGKEIRRLLLSGEFVPVPATELLMFLADRAQHVEQVIKPALDAGQWVICDRYTDSTLAYQLAGRKLDDNGQLREMLCWAEQGLQPDMTLWLDLSVEDAAIRMAERQASGQAANRLDEEKSSFHKSVYGAFQSIQKDNPKRMKRVDAKQSIKQVQSDIRCLLDTL